MTPLKYRESSRTYSSSSMGAGAVPVPEASLFHLPPVGIAVILSGNLAPRVSITVRSVVTRPGEFGVHGAGPQSVMSASQTPPNMPVGAVTCGEGKRAGPQVTLGPGCDLLFPVRLPSITGMKMSFLRFLWTPMKEIQSPMRRRKRRS